MIEHLETLIDVEVVVDTSTPMIYIGTVKKVKGGILELQDVDVHDCHETPTTKEVYIMESRKLGIRKNRRSVWVKLSEIVSVSLLEDVIEY